MPNEDIIRVIASRAWGEVLREKSRELAEDVARRMGTALASQATPALHPAQRYRCRDLRDGALRIVAAKTQTETLEALLTASSTHTPSCGLLVLRGGQAGGWNCIGLTAAENFKRATMDCTLGAAATVVSSAAGRKAKASELDPAFTARLGLASSTEILLLPLLLKERVAALLLAVSGSDDDMAALEVLVQLTQLALDIQAYRKAAPQPAVEAPHPVEPPRKAAVAPPPAPAAYEAAAPAAVTMAPQPVTVAEPVEASQPAAPVVDEAHDRARRFAKLLVEEIKLYNQAKVADGRSQGDLYSRLHDDIEKSRAAYQKRYGEIVKDVDYFTQELIRILADNNAMVMGAGFPG
jgi:hypothetical protein